MKTSRKLLIAALLGAGLVAAGGAVLAHGGKGDGWRDGPRAERMMTRMSEKLGLDEQQQAVRDSHAKCFQSDRRTGRAAGNCARRASAAIVNSVSAAEYTSRHSMNKGGFLSRQQPPQNAPAAPILSARSRR